MRQFFLFSFCVTALAWPAMPVSGAEVSSPRHRVAAADRGKIFRFDAEGRVEWEYAPAAQVHVLQPLENGNLLTQESWTRIVEIDPQGEVVWSYDAAVMNGNAGKRVEVHAVQRLPDGLTMIVENGVGRIIEVDREGRIRHEIRYQVKRPNPHRDVRQARKLKNGGYLVCHEEEGRVTEYNADGKIVWDYMVPLFDRKPQAGHGPEAWGNQVYNALRLPSGNTLIATGNGHSVLEVTPEQTLVWAVHQHDLPGITLAWVTSLEVLPDGHLIIGNCHATEADPQLIEITRDKQVVWTFRDFENLGDSTAASATLGNNRVLR